MAKYINPNMIDASLSYLQSNGNRLTIGTADPTTYAQAMTTFALGTLALSSGNFTLSNGATGRKITLAAATIVVGTSGTVTSLAICGTAGSGTLIISGTCAPTAVTAGGTAILAAWDVDDIGTIS